MAILVTGVLMIAIDAGLYFTNKPRILSFETAYKNNPGEFIQSEIVVQLKIFSSTIRQLI